MEIKDILAIAGVQSLFTTAIGFLFKDYLSSFFKKSGENLAQKIDLKEITEIVKGVESQFNRDFEKFKSDIDILKSTKLSHKQLEKECIIEFHGKSTEWALKLFSIIPYELLDLSDEKFEDAIQTTYVFSESLMSFSRIKMIVDNDQIINICFNLIREIHNYSKDIRTSFLKLKFDNDILEGQRKFPEAFGDAIQKKADSIETRLKKLDADSHIFWKKVVSEDDNLIKQSRLHLSLNSVE